MDYIPTSQKGVANGVAGLDSRKKLDKENMPVHTVDTKAGIYSDDLHDEPMEMECTVTKCGNTAFLYAKFKWNTEPISSGWYFSIPNDSWIRAISNDYFVPFTVYGVGGTDTPVIANGFYRVESRRIRISLSRGNFGDTYKEGYMHAVLPIDEAW